MTGGVGVGPRAPGALEAIQGSAEDRPPRARFGRIWPWIVFIAGFLYFFLPLLATLEFSLRARPSGAAYTNVLNDPQFSATLLYSFVVGVITIIVSIAIIVPTAYWVRLRLPWLRPVVEFVTLMPFVIPPVILAFGLIRSYSGAPFHLTNVSFGSDLLLIAAYTVLSLPYMYRAVDTGLRTIDVRTLTEAAQSMGSGWGRILVQVILPNIRVSLLSGAFLTLAIVIGEYTIASFVIGQKAFGPYLSHLGQNKSYEPAAVSLISFALTWAAMGVIAFLGRSTQGRRGGVQIAGGH
jgi:putative spermidine/putrescine transport system permease protein